MEAAVKKEELYAAGLPRRVCGCDCKVCKCQGNAPPQPDKD